VAIASSLFFIVDLEEEGVLILPIPLTPAVSGALLNWDGSVLPF